MSEDIKQAKDDELAKMFLEELSEARQLINIEGGDVGLCPHCRDTGFIYIEKDGYTGIEARIENEIITFNQCFHGESIYDGSIPF